MGGYELRKATISQKDPSHLTDNLISYNCLCHSYKYTAENTDTFDELYS